jgi:adenine-specific DNA-methyltransferase
MSGRIDKTELIKKFRDLEGLTDEEKSNLIGLLRQHKKYGLVWEDKQEDVEERLREQLPVLTEVKERRIISDAPDAPNHILIEGDNLEALTALSYTHEGKIDVIYIDPPYNTGNKDFVYNDAYVDTEDAYRHSKWLSFMNKRLRIAKRLLSDKGVIFISIDDNEQANLKLLCDEVFGERNCRNIINTRRLDKNLSQQFIHKGIQSLAVGCEYVLVYSKTDTVNLTAIEREASEERKSSGYWKGFWNSADRPTMRYELLGFTPTSGQWKWEKGKALEAVKNYEDFLDAQLDNPMLTLEQYWMETGKCKKFIRRRIENQKGKNKGVEHWVEPTEGILRTSNWTDIITTETSLNMEIDFSSPKSRQLIMEIVKFGSQNKSCTILDFFAGSGTTLHAVMQLNAVDKGKRKCILVTNNENDICERVTYERNRCVIQGYTTPKGQEISGLLNNSLRYYKTTSIPRERTQRNMRALVNAATDLLCVKEDLYEEKPMLGTLKLKPQLARYFSDGQKHMLVVYREEVVYELVEVIKSLELGKSILKIYIFSPSRYAFDDDFYDVQDKVQLVALPAAIYDAYQRVLPKQKERLLDEAAEKPALKQEASDLSFDFEEGGEQ